MRGSRRHLICIFGVLALGLAPTALAQRSVILSLNSLPDIRLDSAGNDYWQSTVSYAPTESAVDGAPDDQFVLMQFDLSSIPVSATVLSVDLILKMIGNSTDSFPAYKVNKAWVPGQVTWKQASTGTLWNTPGANAVPQDRDSLTLFTISVGGSGSRTFPFTTDGVTAIQGWVATSSTNHGFVIANGAAVDRYDFVSANNASTTERPQLAVHTSVGDFLFQQGVSPASYSGNAYAEIGNGPDPRTLNWDGNGLWGGDQNINLFRPDLSSIPAWSKVTFAQLNLFALEPINSTWSLFPCLRPWVESQATYVEFKTGQSWQSPGAAGALDRDPTLLSSSPTPPYGSGSFSFDFNSAGVSWVENWVSGATANNGVLVAETPNTTTEYFLTDRSSSSNQPTFEVRYFEGKVAPTTVLASLPEQIGGPYVLDRRRLQNDALISAGAQTLTATLVSSAPQVVLSSDGTTFGNQVAPVFGAGEGVSSPFFVRGSVDGTFSLQVDAGAAWNFPSPFVLVGDAGLVDSATPGEGIYRVGCDSTSNLLTPLALLFLVLGLIPTPKRSSVPPS